MHKNKIKIAKENCGGNTAEKYFERIFKLHKTDCCFTNLEDTYKLKCYLHSLERTELTNIFDYILHLKEEHSSKMLDYYENKK